MSSMTHSTINLLPPEALAAYVKQRRFSILSRMLVALGFLIFTVAVFVGAAWYYLTVLTKTEQGRLEIERGAQAAQLERSQKAENDLSELSAEVKVLRELKKPQYDSSLLIREVVGAMPAGVRLQTLKIVLESSASQAAQGAKRPPEKQGPTIFLSGKANTRGDILAFEDALDKLAFVESLEGPLENLIKPTDASFSFSLKLKALEGSEVTSPPQTAN